MYEDFYPSATISMTLPKHVEVLYPSPGCGDQNTLTLIMGKNGNMTIYSFATVGEIVRFAAELQRVASDALIRSGEMNADDEGAVGC